MEYSHRKTLTRRSVLSFNEISLLQRYFLYPFPIRSSIMRKVAVYLLAAFLLVSISAQKTVHAQETTPSFIVGGGLSLPIDAEGAKNGPAIRGGVSLPVYQRLHAVLEGHYSQYKPEEDVLAPGVSGKTNLTGANLGVMLHSSSSTVSVYGHGGIGLTRAKAEISRGGVSISNSESALSFTIGGGVHIPINPSIGVALDARYNHAMTDVKHKWMPITLSIVFSP